ncbi:MAG: phosphotransferase [Gemmatimonadetes bacterium]|nr:phosphotransferase [Gemmatimonadota bacterium]
MVEPFRPDIFSVKGPGWVPVSDDVALVVAEMLEISGIDSPRLLASPEQARGLEINSSNLRVHTTAGLFAVKRWSAGAETSATTKTLELMEWLAALGVPVPAPVRLGRRRLIQEHDGSRWSVFEFAAGTWFTGDGIEAESAAQVSGALTDALSQVPEWLTPGAGPTHLTDADDALLERVGGEDRRWISVLGEADASALRSAWSQLMGDWHRLRADPPNAGAPQAAHFDLHPHNLLMQDGVVAAVLDFEACGTMPVGYAMAFAGLKQGRQTVAASGRVADASRVGAAFLDRFAAACPSAAGLTRVADLAAVEVLRRICIILRLNFEQGETSWNKVLPVQLAHLVEARLLFT